MFLRSSLGNFSRTNAASGLDHDNERDLIEEAYNDPKGHTRRFIFNDNEANDETPDDT